MNTLTISMRRLLFVTTLVLITSTLSVLSILTYKYVKSAEAKQKRVQEAANLVDYFYNQNIPVSFNTVYKTVQAIDEYLPVYFSTGPYTRTDFIALAIVESQFNQYALGSRGEKGIFQIMDGTSRNFNIKQNQFDIYVNTQLCMSTLQSKFEAFPDYRKAIIAYNGYNISSGRVIDTYWKKFLKARDGVALVLKTNNP